MLPTFSTKMNCIGPTHIESRKHCWPITNDHLSPDTPTHAPVRYLFPKSHYRTSLSNSARLLGLKACLACIALRFRPIEEDGAAADFDAVEFDGLGSVGMLSRVTLAICHDCTSFHFLKYAPLLRRFSVYGSGKVSWSNSTLYAGNA